MCGRLQPGYHQSCCWIVSGLLMGVTGVIYLIVTVALGGRAALSDPKVSVVPVLCVAGALCTFMGCCLHCNTSQDTYFHWKKVKQKQTAHDKVVSSKSELKGQLMPIVSGFHPDTIAKWP